MTSFRVQSAADTVVYDLKWSGMRNEQMYPTESAKALLGIMQTRFPEQTLRALDLGCGAGRHTIFLAEHGVHVLAIDWNETAIAVLKEKARKIEHGRIRAKQVNAAAYLEEPAESDNFHGIIVHDSLHHMSDQPEVIERLLGRMSDRAAAGAALLVTLLTDIAYGGGLVPNDRLLVSRAAGEQLLRRALSLWAIVDERTQEVHYANSTHFDINTKAVVSGAYSASRILFLLQKM